MGWTTGSSATLFSGEGAISNGNTYLGSAYDNTGSTKYEMCRLTIAGTLGAAPTAGTGIVFWWIRDPDGGGGSYEDAATGTPGATPFRGADCVFNVGGSQTTYQISADILLPPGKPKPLIQNNTGQTMNASWTCTIWPYNP